MKFAYPSLIAAAIACFTSVFGETPFSGTADNVVQLTVLDDPETKELLYLMAKKKIAESGKNIDINAFIAALTQVLNSDGGKKRLFQPYEHRFEQNELAALVSLLKNPVYQKYTKENPDIIVETIKILDSIVEETLAKNTSLVGSKPQVKMIEITSDNYESEVLKSPVPVVLDFYAAWCGPCKGMEAILQNISSEQGGKIKFAKLDIDKEKEIADRYHVKDLPVLLFIKEGKEAGIHRGFADKETIEAKMAEFLGILK